MLHVPIDEVCRDFFGHLTIDKLLRKALRGIFTCRSCALRPARRRSAGCISSQARKTLWRERSLSVQT